MQVSEHDSHVWTATPTRQPMRILVIEDDREAASWLVKGLAEAGHVADHAADGEEGLGLALEAVHDVLIAMGLFALLNLEFTVATVAALLTLIGYSLNDSIIVSDRIRENLKEMRGRSYREIVNMAINQTLSRTIMTSVSTMLPLLSLLIFGGPVLRDFSLVLLVGILIGTYSSIYIVAPLVVYFEEWRDRRKAGGQAAKA